MGTRNRLALAVLLVTSTVALGGRQLETPPADAAPDLVLYNGKIVTVDRHVVGDDLGTIARAIAIKGGAIQAVGTDARIRAMAGPRTKSLDLKGRTVTPGFSATHDHPMDWDTINPYIIRKVITDDVHIERFINVPPGQVVAELNRVMQEALQKAKPGQWIRISLLYGNEYRWGTAIEALLGTEITKELVDRIAPDNPVEVRGGFVGMVLNQRAIDLTKRFYGDQWNKFIWNPYGQVDKTGVGKSTEYRWLEQDVLYPPAQLREIYRLGLSWMAGYGVTLNASGLYTPGAIAAYRELERRKQMAIRFPFSYQWRPRPDFWSDPYFPQMMALQLGKGSDYLWMTGLWPSDNGSDCTTLNARPEVKAKEGPCKFEPGSVNAVALYNMIKAGGRLAGIHTRGDKDIDLMLDVIEKASRDAGLTPEEVRSKRHAYDHLALSPRADQIKRMQKLGMVLGGWNMYIWEGTAQQAYRDYGERVLDWIIPRKSIMDAGIWQSLEIDRPIGYTDLSYFTVMYAGITRKDQNGKVTSVHEAINRGAMLKSATLAGAYYAMREDKLGSLEPGKFADLIVLDRDYLTVPVDDILNVRVLMTMVGGQVVHLVPSLAKEFGMPPTGAQVELGGAASKW